MGMVIGAGAAGPASSARSAQSPAANDSAQRSGLKSGSGPCGHPSAARIYRHVIWVWLENESYGSVIGSSDAPYLNSLAARCGLATNYQGVSHPSLPNYLAATGGSTFGITDDGDPSDRPVKAPSIFSQINAAGLTWRGYDESMPTPCDTTGSGLYAPRHNPAVYYVPLRQACQQSDVALGPMGTGALARDLQRNTLPSFAFVTPNVCHDGHDCSVQTSDAWMSTFLPAVFSSAAYRAGQTVVFVVWDEGTNGNHIPMIVAAPSVRSGTKSNASFNHYSLLRTSEQLLGLPTLGQSANASSMVAAFNL
jgi:phosphatidylinositol-3-phosphatase